MKNIIFFSLLVIGSSAYAADNPFQKFQGKYNVKSCSCTGPGESTFTYDPCEIKMIEVRSYSSAGTLAYVLDEVTDTGYTIRPLDQTSLEPLRGGQPVSVAVNGDSNSAVATFSATGSTNTYELSSASGSLTYAASTKSSGGVDRACSYSLLKRQ